MKEHMKTPEATTVKARILMRRDDDAAIEGEELRDAMELYLNQMPVKGWTILSALVGGQWANTDSAKQLDIDIAVRVHDDLVAIARRAIGSCVCHATMRPDIPCLSCAARAVLAKAGKDV